MGRRSDEDYQCGWVRGKRIGEGCFGTVSIGVDKSDGRVFAVKSVDCATCLPSQLEALEREIRILRSLPSSPYVVRYLADDESFEGSASFRNLHVEYFPGGTAADAAARDEETVRTLTWCLASALRHVHSRGFVHCDVKGRNVLVGPGLGRATLADFGSAREAGAPVGPPRGSPLWMAPEAVRGEGQGPESDVWSLGCTVVEMLSGRPPWEDGGGGAAATLRRIGFSDDLPELPAGLSESGRDFVEKCLRRDPARRWSCDRLLRHPFLAGAAPAPQPGPSPRCVLDCDFDDDDSDDDRSVDESSARERIGKLAATGGANWESDGWTFVRQSISTTTTTANEGVNSEFLELPRAEPEIGGTSSEYSKFGGTSSYCLLVVWLYSLYINIGVLFSYSSFLLFWLLLFVKKFNESITSYILAIITSDVSDLLPVLS